MHMLVIDVPRFVMQHRMVSYYDSIRVITRHLMRCVGWHGIRTIDGTPASNLQSIRCIVSYNGWWRTTNDNDNDTSTPTNTPINTGISASQATKEVSRYNTPPGVRCYAMLCYDVMWCDVMCCILV
jgi:hypothetical protein